MIDKIVYIGYLSLTEKVIEDFYMEDVLSNGYEVEYWDLSNIYFPWVLSKTLNKPYNRNFSTLTEFHKAIENVNGDSVLFVMQITYSFRVIKLFRILTKFKCKTAIFARGAIPRMTANSGKGLLKKIELGLKNRSLVINYLKDITAVLFKKALLIKPYDIVFVAGERGIKVIGRGYETELKNSKIVSINSIDYDKFWTAKISERFILEKYCLFLDEYLPYHPDFNLFNIKTPDPDTYYEELDVFFKNVERKFNISIIIAAHPKANRYKEHNPFNERKIYFNKTEILTKDAEFVLFHGSTSASFAVLYGKPSIALCSNSLKEIMPQYYQFILNYAHELGHSVYNVDEIFTLSVEDLRIDNIKYDVFKDNYLTSKATQNISSYDIFLNQIKNL